MIVTPPNGLIESEYDSSTSPARGFRTFGESVVFRDRVILLMNTLSDVDGSKFEFRGWNFHGTKFCSKSVFCVREMADWTIWAPPREVLVLLDSYSDG